MDEFDTQTINENADLLNLIETELGPAKVKSRWYIWHCPFHQDCTPSLALNPERNFWKCFGCGREGDAIRWTQEWYGLTFVEACQFLGGALRQPASPRPRLTQPHDSLPPPLLWQQRGKEFITEAEACLWKTPQVLAFLRSSRFLHDDTIRRFRLGYNPKDRWEQPEAWGRDPATNKKIFLPKGLVIPGLVESTLWYLKVRTGQPKMSYIHIPGGKPALFNGDDLRGETLILLTEGELDCILTWQEIGDTAGIATLGSCSAKLEWKRWWQYFAHARHILTAYDSDAPGRMGAANLASQIGRVYTLHVPALKPGDKDLTDYYRSTHDLWAWFSHQLERLHI